LAGAAVLGRLTWQIAEVVDAADETRTARTLFLVVPDWPGHQAGQHVDVRLTAEDGYQAQRSYSIASPPGEQPAITVQRLEDGEVSPYLVDELGAGDRLELRGPIGGYFVWDYSYGGPLLLVAGGSGIVPLMSMLRHRAASAEPIPTRLVYSARTLEDVIYRDEVMALARDSDAVELYLTLTRSAPADWTGLSGRVGPDLLRQAAWPQQHQPLSYVCGPTSFVETVASGLVGLGHAPGRIRTERFGGA
jgi:ferredoxin-NADP reductase